jgi:hypothetical protein
MGINPFIPVKQPNGSYKMNRKEPTKEERHKFIMEAMKRIVNDGEVIMTADPDRVPSRVFHHSDMGVFKSNGTWHTALNIEDQTLQIALRYKDYQIQGRDDNQVYMAIRIDLEKMVDIFDNLALKNRK